MHIVITIEDAQNLWRKLQDNVNKDTFDVSKEEGYEDIQGGMFLRIGLVTRNWRGRG
jgi:hypothetical protein